MTTQASYLYGIVPASAQAPAGLAGLDGGEVHTIADGDVAVVTSRSERVPFSRVPAQKALQSLAEHQRVLEQILALGSVIPIKFGTYADDERQVRLIVRNGREAFAEALEQYRQKIEVDVAVLWTDLSTVLSEIGRDPAVLEMKARTDPSQVITEQRVRLGQQVKVCLDARRERIAGHVVEALKAQWPRLAVNPNQSDVMVLSAAVLVGRQEQPRLESTLHQLDQLFANRLTFRCVGPLPPYSFAMAEVQTIEAHRLITAAKSLGVGESASLAQIKQAYRRRLQEAHPDRNPQAGGEGIQKASDAYELLEEYALNYRHTFHPGFDPAVIVRVRSLQDLRTPNKAPREAAPCVA